MSPSDVLDQIPRFSEIYAKPMQIQDQMKYKYHLTIDGNVSTWNVWEYKTNSLIFKYESDNMLWYYPMLQNRTHFVEVNNSTIENSYNYYQNNPKEAEFIIQNANRFAKDMFVPEACQFYTISLFDAIANNK